jgi:hypothetical protein
MSITPISEKGLNHYKRVGKILSYILVYSNPVLYCGLENTVEQKNGIWVSNHHGNQKDVAAYIIKSFLECDLRKKNHGLKPYYFTARKELFDKHDFKKLILKHFEKSGMPLSHRLLNVALPGYLASRMEESGTIPVNVKGTEETPSGLGNGENLKAKKAIEDYLLDGRDVVLFQPKKKKDVKSENKGVVSAYDPYFPRFKKGAAEILHNIYQNHNGLEYPIFPVSVTGSRGYKIGREITLNLGKPMTIGPYMKDDDPVLSLTDAVEREVIRLFRQAEKGEVQMSKTTWISKPAFCPPFLSSVFINMSE